MVQVEVEDFLGRCDQRGLLVQVNYWRRAAVGLRNLANGGIQEMSGNPQAIFITYGNGLFNNGSHMVDLVRMLFGEVADAQATLSAIPVPDAPIAGDVNVPFVLQLRNGATVYGAPIDYRQYRELGLDIWGDKGRVTLYQESLIAHHYPLKSNRGLDHEHEIASDDGRQFDCPVSTALFDMYDNLADAVTNGAELWSSGSSAFKSENILHALLESAVTGNVVSLEC